MSRYLTVLLAALAIVSVIGCEKSKLRDDMMGDSTWESSSGDESWEAADQPPKRNDQWEEENAPLEGTPPAEEQKPESSLEQSYPRVSTGVISRINGKPIERPEQAAAVWENLRTASNLVVDYQRGGEKHALRFMIVDES